MCGEVSCLTLINMWSCNLILIMTKDLKVSALILIAVLPIFLFLLTSIYKQEDPSSLLLHTLTKGQHEFFLGNKQSSYKTGIELQDNINKSISILGSLLSLR